MQGTDLIDSFIKSHPTLDKLLAHPGSSEQDAAVVKAVQSLRRLVHLSTDQEENICQHGRIDPLCRY